MTINAGDTPLIVSARNGNVKTIIQLIKSGADINVTDNNGSSLLNIAFENKYDNLIKLLLDYDIDPNQNDIHGNKIIFYYLENGMYDMVKYFINCGADINKKNGNGDTLLILSCKKGVFEMSKFIIDHGADINLENDEGDSALLASCSCGFENICNYLIDNGADVNKKKSTRHNNDASEFSDNETLDCSLEDLNDLYDAVNSIFEGTTSQTTSQTTSNTTNRTTSNTTNRITNHATNSNVLWIKTSCEWSSQDVFYNEKCIYSKRSQSEDVNNLHLNPMESIKIGCNKLAYNGIKLFNSNKNYYAVLLYESNSRRFYVLFMDKDHIQKNTSCADYQLYFGYKYKFFKLYEFPSQFYFVGQSMSEFPQLKIKLYNKRDEALQTINLKMKEIEGKSIKYNKNSIFYNTGDEAKEKSNQDIINNNPNSFKLAIIDLVDNINPIFV